MTAGLSSAGWQLDLHWLTDRLAVGGWFPMDRVEDLARVHGIDAVVDLREEQCDDERRLDASGIALLHLPTPDMESVSTEHLETGVAFVNDRIGRGGKVLIHCQHGIGRSALLALCVLVDHGWTPLEAIAHAKSRRDKVSPSPAQFEGWCRWLQSRGRTPPTMHDFGCIAYRRPAQG